MIFLKPAKVSFIKIMLSKDLKIVLLSGGSEADLKQVL